MFDCILNDIEHKNCKIVMEGSSNYPRYNIVTGDGEKILFNTVTEETANTVNFLILKDYNETRGIYDVLNNLGVITRELKKVRIGDHVSSMVEVDVRKMLGA